MISVTAVGFQATATVPGGLFHKSQNTPVIHSQGNHLDAGAQIKAALIVEGNTPDPAV
jgi:hypothetical protein